MKAAAILLCLPLLAATPPALTKADVEKMLHSLSNWGRWGGEDQIGALNLITEAKRKQAAALVKEGRSVSLAHNAIKEKTDDSPPFQHKMLETGANSTSGASEIYSVQYHDFTATHMDALCHVFWNGKMYNCFSQKTMTASGQEPVNQR